MDAEVFFSAVRRLGLLTAEDAVRGGVTLSPFGQRQFDDDPIRYSLTECGPARRAQIFALVDPRRPRIVPIVAVIEDCDAPATLQAA